MAALGTMLQDQTGNYSTMRALAFLVVGVITIVWGIISVMKGEMQAIQWQEVVMVVGTLVAKGYQRGNESEGGAK